MKLTEQRYVYPGFERLIESAYAVCSQEEKTFVVLQDAKEDRDDAVATKILRFSFGEKNIRLIEKHYTIPLARECEVLLQILLHIFG
jgi:hypothetical protein